MSGVFGFIDLRENTTIDEKKNILHNMYKAHKFYGKDASDTMLIDRVALGCCVNHIPHDCAVPQPIIERENMVAVIDALLYNREELIKKLEKQKNSNISDTICDEELIFDFYLTFGRSSLADVNGDFAGVIYNKNDNSITLFRDHLGVRPIFYGFDEYFFFFSTDCTLLCTTSKFELKLNESQFYLKIAGYNSLTPEKTLFENVFAVIPAHTLTVTYEDGKFSIKKHEYWKLGREKILLNSEQEYILKLRFLIEDAISRRLKRTNQIIGAELSGGLDSAVIDILINRMGRKAVYYSWSPDKEIFPLQKDDERIFINDICQQEGFTCKYIKVYNNSIEDIEEGNFIIGSFLTDVFAQGVNFFASNGARMVFSGWGGDEGVSHRANILEMKCHGENREYWEEVKYRSKGSLLRFAKIVYNNLLTAHKKKKAWNTATVNKDCSSFFINSEFVEEMDSKVKKNPLYFGTHPIKQIKSGGNRARMELAAHDGAFYGNLQYVFPYLDYRVENFAVSIPRWLFIHNGINRYIYRKTFSDIIPKGLISFTGKSDTGRSNYMKTDEQKIILSESLNYIADKINREYWKKYIDFSLLDELVKNKDELSFYALTITIKKLNLIYCLQNQFKLRATESNKEM